METLRGSLGYPRSQAELSSVLPTDHGSPSLEQLKTKESEEKTAFMTAHIEMSKARVEADEHIEAICKYLCETSSIGPFLCAVYYPGLVSRCIPLCTWVLQFFLLVLLASWFNGEDAAEYGSLHSTVHESEDYTSLARATQYLPS